MVSVTSSLCIPQLGTVVFTQSFMTLAPHTENENQKRILIVDDHPVFRKGIAAVIQEHRNLHVCGEAYDSATALDAMRSLKPDIILLDISLPGTNGIELTKMMLAENPQLGILILSMHDESVYAMRALRAGARGYVMKAEALTHVVTALNKVIGNGIYVSAKLSESLIYNVVQGGEGAKDPLERLSDREMEVFQWIGRGFGTKEIANALNLSAKTIETHRVHIKEKLGFYDARELSRFAIEWAAQQQNPT